MKFLVFIIITLLLVGCYYNYISQLQIGMTKEEVIASAGYLGAPRVATTTNAGVIEIYEVGFIDAPNYYLIFRDGRLVGYEITTARGKPDLLIKIE